MVLFFKKEHPSFAAPKFPLWTPPADLIVGSGLRADGAVPNGEALPGYYTINLAAIQTLHIGVLQGTQLRLDIINLLNRRYETRNCTGVGAPQFGLRRTLLAGVAQRF